MPVPLLTSPAPLRRVTAGVDAPWTGMLVRTDDGAAGVLVDAAALGASWHGWSMNADGHVLGALDVLRRADGHDVLVPVCEARVADVLRRREQARLPLTSGEAVTLAVSAVRAHAALGDVDSEPDGEWWLTDDRRPVLATDVPGERVTDATRTLIESLGAGIGAERDALLAALTSWPPRARELELLEERLFALAPAEAVADAALAPRAARGFDALLTGAGPAEADDDQPRRGLVDRLARHVDADIADLVSRATTGVWRRLRTKKEPGPPRGRVPWVVAGGAAAVVLGVGMLWPASEEPPAVAAATPEPSATQPSADQPSTEPIVAQGDVVAAAAALLERRLECGTDAACLGEIAVAGSGPFPAGVIDLPVGERVLALVDDVGGVAVVRVDAVSGSEPSVYTVVQREGDRWLLRDVYAAQQP